MKKSYSKNKLNKCVNSRLTWIRGLWGICKYFSEKMCEATGLLENDKERRRVMETLESKEDREKNKDPEDYEAFWNFWDSYMKQLTAESGVPVEFFKKTTRCKSKTGKKHLCEK